MVVCYSDIIAMGETLKCSRTIETFSTPVVERWTMVSHSAGCGFEGFRFFRGLIWSCTWCHCSPLRKTVSASKVAASYTGRRVE
jgi:hypothetical protein